MGAGLSGLSGLFCLSGFLVSEIFQGDWGSGMTIDLFEPVSLLETIAYVH